MSGAESRLNDTWRLEFELVNDSSGQLVLWTPEFALPGELAVDHDTALEAAERAARAAVDDLQRRNP